MSFSKALDDYAFEQMCSSVHNYNLDDFPELCAPSVIGSSSAETLTGVEYPICITTAQYNAKVAEIEARQQKRMAIYYTNRAKFVRYIKDSVMDALQIESNRSHDRYNRLLDLIDSTIYGSELMALPEIKVIIAQVNGLNWSLDNCEVAAMIDGYMSSIVFDNLFYSNSATIVTELKNTFGKQIVNEVIEHISWTSKCHAIANQCDTLYNNIKNAHYHYDSIWKYNTQRVTLEASVRELTKYDLAAYMQASYNLSIINITARYLYRLGILQEVVVNGVNYGNPIRGMAAYGALTAYAHDTGSKHKFNLKLFVNKQKLSALILFNRHFLNIQHELETYRSEINHIQKLLQCCDDTEATTRIQIRINEIANILNSHCCKFGSILASNDYDQIDDYITGMSGMQLNAIIQDCAIASDHIWFNQMLPTHDAKLAAEYYRNVYIDQPSIIAETLLERESLFKTCCDGVDVQINITSGMIQNRLLLVLMVILQRSHNYLSQLLIDGHKIDVMPLYLRNANATDDDAQATELFSVYYGAITERLKTSHTKIALQLCWDHKNCTTDILWNIIDSVKHDFIK